MIRPVLASILPGLREIRAPLAAGYLWLVTGWLLLHDRVETGTSAPGAVDALDELRDAIGVGGIAAAATFVAYLLGALWEPLAIKVAELGWPIWKGTSERQATGRWLSGPPPSAELMHDLPGPVAADLAQRTWADDIADGFSNDFPPPRARLSRSAWRRLWLIGRRVFGEIDEIVISKTASFDLFSAWRELEPVLIAAIAERASTDTRKMPSTTGRFFEAEDAYAEFEGTSSARDDWWLEEASDLFTLVSPSDMYLRVYLGIYGRMPRVLVLSKPRSSLVDLLSEAEVAEFLFDELPLVARHLVGEQQEASLEASRMKAEVEFRYALAIPLPLVISVAAWGLGVPIWAWLAATAAGLLAGWALLADGWRRDAARNDYLVEQLEIGRAKSPRFERLRERARQTGIDRPGKRTDEAVTREARN